MPDGDSKKNRQAYSHKMLVLWTPDDILYYSRHSTTNPENRYALETHLQLYLFTSMLWYRDGVFPSPTLKTPSLPGHLGLQYWRTRWDIWLWPTHSSIGKGLLSWILPSVLTSFSALQVYYIMRTAFWRFVFLRPRRVCTKGMSRIGNRSCERVFRTSRRFVCDIHWDERWKNFHRTCVFTL